MIKRKTNKTTRKVQIKTWEEMGEEYNYIEGSGISFPEVYFTKEMEELLPKDRIIEVYYNETWEEWLWRVNKDVFSLAEEMIKEEIKLKGETMENIKIRYYVEIDTRNGKEIVKTEYTLDEIGKGGITHKKCNEITRVLFVGSEDKIGIEIYGGDIVRCRLKTDKNYWRAEVKWCIDAWCLGLHTMSSYIDIEVIGNIYENPELLED